MFITAIATWTELDYKSLILKISQLLALIQAKCTVALGKLELSRAGELLHLYAPARGLPALITDDGELNLLLHNNRGVKFSFLTASCFNILWADPLVEVGLLLRPSPGLSISNRDVTEVQQSPVCLSPASPVQPNARALAVIIL